MHACNTNVLTCIVNKHRWYLKRYCEYHKVQACKSTYSYIFRFHVAGHSQCCLPQWRERSINGSLLLALEHIINACDFGPWSIFEWFIINDLAVHSYACNYHLRDSELNNATSTNLLLSRGSEHRQRSLHARFMTMFFFFHYLFFFVTMHFFVAQLFPESRPSDTFQLALAAPMHAVILAYCDRSSSHQSTALP